MCIRDRPTAAHEVGALHITRIVLILPEFKKRLVTMLRNDLGTRVLALPRAVKRLIVLGVDAAICVFTVWLAFYLRIGIWPSIYEGPAFPISTAVAIALPLFVSFGLYRAIFRYAGWTAITTIAQSVVLYTIPFAGIFTPVSYTHLDVYKRQG